jgi:hypothetical protein
VVNALNTDIAYVAHPLGSGVDRDANRMRAMRWCGWVVKTFGVASEANWIVLSGVWDETPENRALGIECDLVHVRRSDFVLLVGGRVSPGMRIEAMHAVSCGIPVYDLTALGAEPPAVDVAPKLVAWVPEAA